MNLKVLDKIKSLTAKLGFVAAELESIALIKELNEIESYEERYAIIEPYIDALTQAARSPEPVKTKAEAKPKDPPKKYQSIEHIMEDEAEDVMLSQNALGIYEALMMDKKILAIKEIRHVAKVGLKEAKEFVDAYWDNGTMTWTNNHLTLNGVLIWDYVQVSAQFLRDVLEKTKGGS